MLDLEKKSILLKDLHEGTITLVFTKADKNRRKMICTLNSEYLPPVPVLKEGEEAPKARKKNDDVCPVWDVEAKGWRAFRWDSVLCWSTPEDDKYAIKKEVVS